MNMQACPEREDPIILDSLGELDPAEQRDWLRHAAACPRCREAGARLTQTLSDMKAAFPVTPMSEAETERTAAAIRRQIRPAEKAGILSALFRVSAPRWAAAAVFAACLILAVVAGWKPDQTVPIPAPPGVSSGQQVSTMDMEIIRNLEMLRNFQTIEKLIRAVDSRSDGAPPDRGREERDMERSTGIQGRWGYV